MGTLLLQAVIHHQLKGFMQVAKHHIHSSMLQLNNFQNMHYFTIIYCCCFFKGLLIMKR